MNRPLRVIGEFRDLLKAERTAGCVCSKTDPNKPTHTALVAGIDFEYLLTEDVSPKDFPLLGCSQPSFVTVQVGERHFGGYVVFVGHGLILSRSLPQLLLRELVGPVRRILVPFATSFNIRDLAADAEPRIEPPPVG